MTTLRNIFLVFLFFEIGFLATFAYKRSNYKRFSATTIANAEYDRIQELADGSNNIVHFPLATAKSKSGVLLSPDEMFSAISYNLSEHPLGLYIPVPSSAWSVSFYDETSNNYYSLDDRFSRSNSLQLTLAMGNQKVNTDDQDVQVVRSPSTKGIVIIRYVVPSNENKTGLFSIRNEMKSGLLKPENI